MTVRRVTAAEAVAVHDAAILRGASGEAGYGEFAAWVRSQAR